MVNNLRRCRARIEREVIAPNSILAAGSGRGEQRFMIQEREVDVTEMDKRVAEVLQLCN